jgi:hypothetical protein
MAPADDDSTRDPRDRKTVNVVLEAVPLAVGAPSGPKSPAPKEAIRHALRCVHSAYPDGEGPNLDKVCGPVKQFLAASNLEASKAQIQAIAYEPEFKKKRRPWGIAAPSTLHLFEPKRLATIFQIDAG